MSSNEALDLLKYVLHLRMHGENAPGGSETWREFDTRCEAYLRKTESVDQISAQRIEPVIQIVENHVEKMYRLKFGDSLRPPPVDVFKASAMAEIARQIKNRAVKIEEDWIHFTRD